MDNQSGIGPATSGDDARTHRPCIDSERTVGEALAIWQAAGRSDGIAVTKAGGAKPIADLFFADPEIVEQLHGAAEIQERLLPRSVPDLPGWEFAGRYLPAEMVGGDYWSVKYYPDEDVITCKLADVTGHGIGAAILMAAVKFVSGVLFRYSPSPASVMERTNHSLLRETTADRMATMVYAWITPETRAVRLVNAGHAPAFVCRAGGEIEDLPSTGPLLGLMDTPYEEIALTLAPGDLLFFCSDGIVEIGDPPRFDDAGVKNVVAALRDASADRIADGVLQSARGEGGPIRDDMSILVIKAVATADEMRRRPVPAAERR